MSEVKTEPSIHIRWMLRRDMQEIMVIENEVFNDPFSEEQILGILKRKNIIGMVAEIENKVAAYMIYEFFDNRINVIKFAIPEFMNQQIADQMIQKLKSKLQKKHHLDFCVAESNLKVQLFLKQHSFLATKIIHSDDASEDVYFMRFSRIPSDYKNRIKTTCL